MIRVGSFFTGIGGLDLGFETALASEGIACEVAFQVEIDPFCRAVLAKHWPHVNRSVVDVTDRQAVAKLPRVDVFVGGSPCQDLSSAGSCAGLDGPQSRLWYNYRDAIEDHHPAIVLIENVASGKRRYLCQMRDALHKLGYRTRAFQVGAWEVGAPHKRERIFIVGWRGLADAHGGGRQESSRTLCEEWRRARDSGASDDTGLLDYADTERRTRSDAREECAGLRGGVAAGAGGAGATDAVESGVGRAAHGVSARMDGGQGVQEDSAEDDQVWLIDGRWPAGRGQPQEPWEPRRTAPAALHRRSRLKALGNAVVPAQVALVVRTHVVPLLRRLVRSSC